MTALRGLLAGVLALVLAGCAGMERSAGADLATEIGVQYATMKLIAQAEDPAARAARLVQIADAVLARGEVSVPAGTLGQALWAYVDRDRLAPEDAWLAEALVAAIERYVDAQVAAPESLAEVGLVALTRVAQLVRQAALGYARGAA